jgi:hypothetical protein
VRFEVASLVCGRGVGTALDPAAPAPASFFASLLLPAEWGSILLQTPIGVPQKQPEMSRLDWLAEGLTQSLRRLAARLASRPIWTVLASATTGYLVITRAWAWYRLRHIKGPFWASWTDLWLIRKTLRCELFDSVGQLCEEHGTFPTLRNTSFRAPYEERRGRMLTNIDIEQAQSCASVPTISHVATRLRSAVYGRYARSSIVPIGTKVSGWIRHATVPSPCATMTPTMLCASS